MMELFVEVGDDGIPFVQLNKCILRLDLEDLDLEFQDIARNELRETPENVADALAKLRELIEDEDGLNLPLDDDAFLIKFLRPCKFYPESTFRVMKRFYKFKLKYPKYGQDLMPSRVAHVFGDDMLSFLPTRTSFGSRLMVVQLGKKWNPKRVTLQDMFRSVMMALEVAMIEPKTQVGGVHVILNMEGLSLVHVCQFTPSFAKLVVDFVQECTPVRLKGIHVINQPYIFNMLYALFKPFLGEKLRKRLFFHGTDRQSLCDKVPEDCLPEYLGGTVDIPDYPGKLLAEMLSYYEKEFELCNTLGYTKEKAQMP